MDDLELIKEKLNIVDIVSEYLPLKKAGVNFKANCPFHNESTPSFVVSPERQIWHCFGCDRGGDMFKFLMEKESLDFKDALEILAKKAGITLKKTNAKKDGKDTLFEANQKAQQFFNHVLTNLPLGKGALDYLHKRGLTDETIKQFSLGYAPNSWESLTSFLKKRGFTTQDIIDGGLGVASKGGVYDRFRGRVMFPLSDVRDRIIGFAGRILDKGEPKYVNTPQTIIFDKRRLLYGLHLSKGEIKQKGEAILVEGEMDMIMSFQSGVKNIVATKGTALTEEHIETLKKYTETISLCFDMDLAGDAASRRGIEMADRAGLNIKVIQLKNAKDPAETCLKDVEIWQKAVKDAVPIYDYYLQSAQKRYSPKDALGKRSIFNELLPIFRKITDPMTKEHYIQKLSALLQVKDSLIRSHLEKLDTQVKVGFVKSEPPKKEVVLQDRRSLLEDYLIALILHIPLDHIFVPNFPETIFSKEDLKQIYVMLVIFLDKISFKGKTFKIVEFIKTLPQDLSEVVDQLYLMEIDTKLEEKNHWQKEIELVVGELKKILIKSSLEKLSLQIKNAQEFEQLENLTLLNKKFRDLSVKLKNL